MACAKHFPGHGRADADSHATLPSVTLDATWLERDDLAPFRDALDAGVASVMTAHVAYPALDPSGAPATLSAPILTALLRGAMEFDGSHRKRRARHARRARGGDRTGRRGARDRGRMRPAARADRRRPDSRARSTTRCSAASSTQERVRDALERRDRWAHWARPGAGRETVARRRDVVAADGRHDRPRRARCDSASGRRGGSRATWTTTRAVPGRCRVARISRKRSARSRSRRTSSTRVRRERACRC